MEGYNTNPGGLKNNIGYVVVKQKGKKPLLDTHIYLEANNYHTGYKEVDALYKEYSRLNGEHRPSCFLDLVVC